MDAKNNPVGRPKKEFHSSDVPLGQRDARNLDLPVENETLIALSEGGGTDEDYHAELAFMEEPVTIRISASSEKNAPTTMQCWVNGKGAEHFRNGKWLVCGWLPIGQQITTRRKYVEVLLRSRSENVSTRVVKHEDREDNMALRTASTKYPVSIIGDTPKGHEWASRILQEQ